jgi:hypothetical protein
MESLFGEDLSTVKAHTGAANTLASVGARGAAQGETVAFASTTPGPSLVAHETAHIVQQRRAGGSSVAYSREESAPDDPAEREAEDIAALVETHGEDAPPVTVEAAPTAEIHFDRGPGTPPPAPLPPGKAPPPGGEHAPPSWHSDGRPELLDWAGVTPLRNVLGPLSEHSETEVRDGTLTTVETYVFALQGDPEVRARQGDRDVPSKSVFAAHRVYRFVFKDGLRATVTIDSRAHLPIDRGVNDLRGLVNIPAVQGSHDALIVVEGPAGTNQVPPVKQHASGQSLAQLLASDPLLAFDTEPEDRAAHLKRRVFAIRGRDRLAKRMRAVVPKVPKAVERLKAHTAAVKDYLDGDREALLEAEELLAEVAALKTQLALDVERKEGATEAQLAEAEQLYKELHGAYIEAKNARAPERGLADHAKDVAMAPVHAAVSLGEGGVELGKMGVDLVRAGADGVANLLGGDIEWQAYSGVGKALQDGKGAGDILVAAWDGFVDQIDKAIEQAKNGNYGPLLDLKASIELEVAITLATGGSYAPAVIGARIANKVRQGGQLATHTAEALARLTTRTAKALKDARALLKMPGVKAWAKDITKILADSLDRLAPRFAAAANGTSADDLLRHLPDVDEGNQMLRQSALDVAKGDAAKTLKKRGGGKGKGLSAVETDHLLKRLEGLITKAGGTGTNEIKAIFGAMRHVDNLPRYVDAIEALLSLKGKRIEQPDLLKVLKRSTAVVDGVQFLDNVAWVAKRDISDAARHHLFDKAARSMAPDFAWLRKTNLSDRWLDYLASNPATNWKTFMKVSAEESDQFPAALGARGLDGGDHADAAAKLRGVAGELVVKDMMKNMKLPGGLRWASDQVNANGKLIDFGLVDAKGQPALLEVKGWTPKKWKQQLAAFGRNKRGAEAIVHALSQLEAAVATKKKVYLAVSDALEKTTLKALEDLLDAEQLPVTLIPFSESGIKTTAHQLRSAMAIGAGVAFFLDNEDSSGSEDDEPDASAI